MTANPRHLPLLDLRREILTCHRWFDAPAKCWHHEDVVGGYALGRVAVVGVNPQAAKGNSIYETIRDASWQTKVAPSDKILDVFAGRASFEDIHPGWGWMNGRHRGLATWLPRVCKHLDVTPEILADHFAFVEAFKHATPDQPTLMKERGWDRIRVECPCWLVEQLVRLKPRLVVLCGPAGKDIIAPLLFDEVVANELREAPVREMHGRTESVHIGEMRVPVVFTLAISGQTAGRWRTHPRTVAVRDAVRAALSTEAGA